MELSDKLIRSFTEVVNSSENKKTQNPAVLGTASKVDGVVTVTIDGSTLSTPAETLVDVETGDRVDVVIQDHKAVITGNHSSPALTRYKKVYATMSAEGVVVGMLDDEDKPTGTYLLINAANGTFQVIDSNKKILASFGETAQIGRSDKPHTLTTNSEFQVVNSNGVVVAKFGESAQIGRSDKPHVGVDNTTFYICDSSGNVLASFGSQSVIGESNKMHTVTNSTGFHVLDSQGKTVASFGEQAVVGYGEGALHTITNDSGFNVLKNGKVVAAFGEFAQIGAADIIHAMIEQTGFVLRDGSGNVLASFGSGTTIGKANEIHLVFANGGISVKDGSNNDLAVFAANSRVDRLETSALGVFGNVNDEARAVVRASDSTGVTAEGRLAATPGTKRFGLFDGIHNKWLINSEADGKVLSRTSPTVLVNTTYTATTINASSFVNVPIADLNTWSYIVVFVRAGNEHVSLDFFKGGPTFHKVNYYNANRLVTGEFYVEWNSNRLRFCCASGTGTDYSLVSVRYVYGIFKS